MIYTLVCSKSELFVCSEGCVKSGTMQAVVESLLIHAVHGTQSLCQTKCLPYVCTALIVDDEFVHMCLYHISGR